MKLVIERLMLVKKQLKHFTSSENYTLTDFLLERNFMFKAIYEINEELTKNKEVFLIHFVNEAYNLFDDQTLLYREEKGYYDYEDQTFDKNGINEGLYYLDSLIKKHIKNKKFIKLFKKTRN